MTAFAKEEIIQPDLSKTGFGYTLQKKLAVNIKLVSSIYSP